MNKETMKEIQSLYLELSRIRSSFYYFDNEIGNYVEDLQAKIFNKYLKNK